MSVNRLKNYKKSNLTCEQGTRDSARDRHVKKVGTVLQMLLVKKNRRKRRKHLWDMT